MMRRMGLGGCLILVLVGCAALGNVPPTMEDQYVSTVENIPVSFAVRVQDEDIDPTDPNLHPLAFTILEGPSHGVLIGDLGEIFYEDPHTGFVLLTYTPANGYVGIDYVTISVMDPFGASAAGTTTIQIDVRERRIIGLLSGSLDSSLTLIPQTTSIALSAFRTRITEVYRIGRLSIQGIADWKYSNPGGGVFDALRFEASLPLAAWGALQATLAFDPKQIDSTNLFDYLRTATSFSVFDIGFAHTLFFTEPQTASYQTIVVSGSICDFSFRSTMKFEMLAACSFSFEREDLYLSWNWCDLKLTSTLALTDADGFDHVSFKAHDLPFPIPGFVTPSFGLYVDLEVKFQVDSKAVTPTLKLKTAWVDCIQLYAALVQTGPSNTTIDELSIYGLKIQHTLPDGILIQMATSFVDTKNSTVTGQTDYFEMILVSGTTMSCCGTPGTWSVATYFQSDHSALFDWGMTVVKLNLGLTDLISASTEMVVRSGTFGDPKLELTVGVRARW